MLSILNASFTLIMLLVIAVYFFKVVRHIKLRQDLTSRIRQSLVTLALLVRFLLAVYDCWLTTAEINSQYWRYYLLFYIDIAQMMVYLTLIFRVVGSWTLFSQINNHA